MSRILQHMDDFKKSFSYRAFNIFVVSVLLIGVISIAVISNRTEREVERDYYTEISGQLSMRYNLLTNQLDTKVRQIRFLHDTPPVKGIMRATANNGIDPLDGTARAQWINRLKIIFKSYIDNHPDIIQLRYIGVAEQGKEIVRVDRRNNVVNVVDESALQRKGESSYFKAVSKLSPSDVYISDLNLNREYGKLDFPYVPTLRIAMPVFDQSQTFFGLIVINVKASILLAEIQQELNDELQLYLINKKGYFKIHPDSSKTFGEDLDKTNRWNNFFTTGQQRNGFTVVKHLISGNELLYQQKRVLFPHSGDPYFLDIIVGVPTSHIETIVGKRRNQLVILVAATLFVVIVIASIYQSHMHKRITLLEAKYMYEAIVLGSLDAIVSMDLKGKVTNWNHAAQKIFGYLPEQAIGKTIFELIVPKDDNWIKPDTLYKLSVENQEPFDFSAKKDNGDLIDVSISFSPITFKDQKNTGISAIIRDITQQKETQSLLSELNESLEEKVACRTKELEQARKKAVEANEAKSNFLANISHEIRTPMNAILGLTYLLQKQSLSTTALNMVQKIHSSGENLLGIINDILDFSKIEAHRLDIECISFQLADVMDNVANIMSSAVGDKPIEVIMAAIPHGAENLKGDPLRLGQILINLTGNALKFTKRGEVVVGMTRVNEHMGNGKVRIRFSVRDTGVGIPLEKQQSIFEAFSQVDTSTTRTFGGTGLGLAISKQLVSLMGGELQLFSEEGVGSEFYFELTFPISDPLNNSIPKMLNQRILIADDHDVALALIVDTAASLGWRPESTSSGQGVLDKLSEFGHAKFDALLLDWRMPGIDGLTVATTIHDEYPDFDIPIIMMVNAADRAKLYEHPANSLIEAVITKPITSSSLYNTMLEYKNRKGEIHKHVKPLDAKRVRDLVILVVDDNEINRMVAKNILSSEGADVELAENGSNAYSILAKNPTKFDVVLMDVQMPVMDGYAATREMRLNKELRDIPVIALTAAVFKADREAAIRAGMNDFVPKPFDVEELINAVLRCTKKDIVETDIYASPVDKVRDVPLFSEELGIKKWTDVNSYQSQLAVFLEHHENDIQRISDAIDSKDISEAKRLCHKLRGSAGALVLMPLCDRTSELECGLQDQRQDCRHLVNQLTTCMKETVRLVKEYLSTRQNKVRTSAKVVTSAEVANNALTKSACKSVLNTLHSDNPCEVEKVIKKVEKHLPQNLVEEINACLEKFDFRRAETLVEDFINSKEK